MGLVKVQSYLGNHLSLGCLLHPPGLFKCTIYTPIFPGAWTE